MAFYLVTGGCGFIGSHLCDTLIAAGHAVRILDDLSTGKRENPPPDCELIVGDVADPDTVERAVSGVDGCFHLAAIASVERSTEAWAATHRVNQGGTINVLDAARRSKQGRAVPVVYASSAAVYGDNPDVPLAENATTRPLSAYGADKLGSEQHARVAGYVHGVPTTGLRIFNIYGPRQDPASPYSGVISIFADRLIRGEAATVNGDGAQVRDFVHVGDCVKFLLAAMNRASVDAEVYNVCTGKATSVLDLAAALGAAAGRTLELHHGPARRGDIRRSVGDPARAAATLGLRAETTLRDGLADLLESLRP